MGTFNLLSTLVLVKVRLLYLNKNPKHGKAIRLANSCRNVDIFGVVADEVQLH